MFRAHVIEIAGRVAGAAVQASGRYRFGAINPRLEEIHGSEWASVAAG